MGIFTNDIIIQANTDGKTGTTKISYSNYLTGKLLGFSYLPTTGTHLSSGNSVGDMELKMTRRSTGATQDDVLVKTWKVYPTRKHFSIASPVRGSTGAPVTTDYWMPYLPLADEQLRVVIQPATSANSKDATIRLLVEGNPGLVHG